MATPDRFPLPQVPDSTRKPEWLKVRLPHGEGYERVKSIVRRTKLSNPALMQVAAEPGVRFAAEWSVRAQLEYLRWESQPGPERLDRL